MMKDVVAKDPAGLDISRQIDEMGRRASAAARILAGLDAATKSACLRTMADGIEAETAAIAEANAGDVAAARSAGLADALIDRLTLDGQRIEAMAEGVRQVAALEDPVGRVLATRTRPNGLVIEKVSVPLGVIAMIYESRPNVTADAAALCVKAGNAVILRGGSEATRSNRAILDAMTMRGEDLPPDAVQLVATTDREAVRALLQLERHVDLVIPRGGEGLVRTVAELSRVPVLKHYAGVCHVYVDRSADLEMASRIAVNAKCQRPGVCNAMETLLVHRDVADRLLPRLGAALIERGVELRGDEVVRRLLPQAVAATEEDWGREYLALILAVRVVDDLDAAIEHIETYGTGHTDVIVTDDGAAAERFTRLVDSATVYVNASSRFTDGFEFGMGAEIGISTDKLHARGPCGVEELTTYKYVVRGTGQVR